LDSAGITLRWLSAMRNAVNIYAVGNFYLSAATGLMPLKDTVKSVCGRHINRIDRLTQLALIGAVQCVRGFDLPEQTGLFMSSIYGSLNNTASVLSEMYQHGQGPGPLKFINTVSNASCYYLSRELNLQASNVFISRLNFALEGCIKLALLDINLKKIDGALIGLVCEAGMPIDIHYQRLNAGNEDSAGEGSHWLLLAAHLPGKTPLASIEEVVESLSLQSMLERIRPLLVHGVANKTLVFGNKVQLPEQTEIAEALGIKPVTGHRLGKPVHEFATALDVCEFILSGPARGGLLHIDTDNNGGWSAMLVTK
jgi:hypothetical protein